MDRDFGIGAQGIKNNADVATRLFRNSSVRIGVSGSGHSPDTLRDDVIVVPVVSRGQEGMARLKEVRQRAAHGCGQEPESAGARPSG